MNRSSDYHSNHRMHLEVEKGILHTQTDRSQRSGQYTNRQGTKTTAQSEKTARERKHLEPHTTQARTCGIEPTQIPDSLREHNRRQENNKQHEQPTKHEHEGGTTTTTRANKATHTRSSTLPTPQKSGALCGEADHDTNEKQNQTTTKEGEGGPSTRRDKLYNAN